MLEPIITFEARAEWFGLMARDVREIARLSRGMRSVPRAPEVIAGLAEVHGRVVTLIDLERLIPGGEAPAREGAGGSAPAGPADLGVVLGAPYDHLGLLVRSDIDVASATEEAGTPVLGGEATWLKARLPVGDRLLNLLSLPALVLRVEETIRKGFRPRGPDELDEVS